MSIFRLNHTLLFVLITAFLTMQWSTVHIHLAEHHNPDDSHHQHEIAFHAHYSIGHHADAIGFSHQAGSTNVVELDHKYSAPKIKVWKKLSSAAITPAFQLLSSTQPICIQPLVVVSPKRNHFYFSIVNLRGPPLFS